MYKYVPWIGAIWKIPRKQEIKWYQNISAGLLFTSFLTTSSVLIFESDGLDAPQKEILEMGFQTVFYVLYLKPGFWDFLERVLRFEWSCENNDSKIGFI